MSFKNLSIRKKLTVLMMSISVLILLLVSGLYLVEEFYSSRKFLEQGMMTLGTTLGDSCKKLLMQREIDTTKDILSSLRMQSNIRSAYLFDENGSPVAQYIDPNSNQFVLRVIPHDFPEPSDTFWVVLSQPKISSSWQHLSLFLPIMHDDRQVGSLYLLSDLNDFYLRFNGVVLVVLLLSAVLMFLSWWLAGKLQRPVSAPLLDLADTMETISERQDFSVRAEKQGQDEIGLLVDGFNDMLKQIEIHRQELVDHQLSLEKTVDQRTEELRKMVAVLELAKQQAEAASEAKSQFLANITHELRTPLIGVLGMNELMFRTSMDDQQKMLASTVQNSGENLLTLINNVLDFSKIEAGKMQLETKEFALYQLVEEVVDLLAGQAEEKGLSLYCKIPLDTTCRVRGDEVRVRQILMNLVGNAVKFTERGQVEVRLQGTDSAHNAMAFRIEIADTGIGMDREAQKQIFSAFHQADASHTRKYGGTGLGLAIVQQLVELLGGKLGLESRVGQGSLFTVELSFPLVEETSFSLPESLIRQTVLLCSEDLFRRELLVERLEAMGMKVVIAESAAEGWYQLNAASRQQKPFELFFFSADAMLPDGQPLCQAIRAQASFRNLRCILLLKRSEVVELRPQDYKLYLPIGWDSLYATLSKCWHELHLVENRSSAPTANEDLKIAIGDRQKLMLVGGNAAGRELIKVALADLSLDFVVVKDLSQMSEMVAEAMPVAILADLSGLSAAALLEFYGGLSLAPPLLVVCSSKTDAEILSPLAVEIIEKPFDRNDLSVQLQMLSEAHVKGEERGRSA